MELTKPVNLFRFVCALMSLLMVYGLFHYGAQPIAAGLFQPPVDKIAHAATFGLLAVMLWFVFGRRYTLLAIVLVALIAAADEIHQIYLPGRYAGMDDWLAAVGGACLPLILPVMGRKGLGKRDGTMAQYDIQNGSPGLPGEMR